MSYGRRIWTLYIDRELRLVHAERNCREAKVAVKYNYLESASVREGDGGQLRSVFSEALPCPSCQRSLARRPVGHPRPPGFREGLP